MRSILLVEDSIEVHRMVSSAISGPLVRLDWAQSVASAEELISKTEYDLLLLDIELPDGNGLEFCSKLQADQPQLPVFILTAHDDLAEKVLGFSVGADDYITKPFDRLELKARVEAKLRKREIQKQFADSLNWKEIKINKSRQEVSVLKDQDYEPVSLTALEFKLLTYFADRPGEVLDRDRLLNEIWGEDIHVYARSVDTHVSKLRKKLGPASNTIQSVHGMGYKFTPSHS